LWLLRLSNPVESVFKLFDEVNATPSDEDIRVCIDQEKRRAQKKQLDNLVAKFTEAGEGKKQIVALERLELNGVAIQQCAQNKAENKVWNERLASVSLTGLSVLFSFGALGFSYAGHRRLREVEAQQQVVEPG